MGIVTVLQNKISGQEVLTDHSICSRDMQWSSHDCRHLVSLFGRRRSRFSGKSNSFEQERSSRGACANECHSEHLPATIVSQSR